MVEAIHNWAYCDILFEPQTEQVDIYPWTALSGHKCVFLPLDDMEAVTYEPSHLGLNSLLLRHSRGPDLTAVACWLSLSICQDIGPITQLGGRIVSGTLVVQDWTTKVHGDSQACRTAWNWASWNSDHLAWHEFKLFAFLTYSSFFRSVPILNLQNPMV